MNDSFENLVRDSIARLTDGAEVPAGLVARARQNVLARRRRKIAWRAAGAGLASTVAAVAVVAVVIPSGPPRPGRTIAAQTTAQVISRVQRAVAVTIRSDPVVFTRSTTKGLRYYITGMYTYQVQGSANWYRNGVDHSEAFGPGGRLVDSTRIVRGSDHNLEVNYRHRTWWDIPKSGLLTVGTGCQLHNVGNVSAADWAAGIRKLLTCGDAKFVGHQWVHGVRAIKLRLYSKRERTCGKMGIRKPGRPVRWYRNCIWGVSGWNGYLLIDPSNYLPIRLTSLPVSFFGKINSPSPTEQVDFAWLAPTKANLARLRLVIPPGFRHIRYRIAGSSRVPH